jgi:Sulfatase
LTLARQELMKARTILTGCGVSVVTTMPYIWPLLSPYRLAFYHSLHYLSNIIWAVLLDFVVISVLATLFFYYFEKRGNIYRNLIWVLVAVRLVAQVLQVHSSTSWPIFRLWKSATPLVLILLAGLAFWWLLPRAYETMAKGFAALLTLAGLSALWIVPELLYLGSRHKAFDPVLAHSQPASSRAAESGSSEHAPRIVWLVFDELSYDQAFEHRFPGLRMPAFDRLKGNSFLFQNVQPAAYYTERAVASLLLGKVVDGVKGDLDGRAIIKLSGQKSWSILDPQATLFGDARRNGWTSGLAGWWNPYCRMLPDTLDSCYWSTDESNGIFSTENSVLENAAAPFLSKMRNAPAITVEQKHRASLQAIMQQGQALIRDEKIRFIFIHLPVPHPPGIYDRSTGKLRDAGTYIDNLALADRSLDELISSLSATTSAGNTTLIVSADHSWRTPMWRSNGGLFAEEQAASQGRFDPRPMLMIRLPKQTHEVDVSQPFAQVDLNRIIVSMLQRQIESADDLKAWLQLQLKHGLETRPKNTLTDGAAANQ